VSRTTKLFAAIALRPAIALANTPAIALAIALAIAPAIALAAAGPTRADPAGPAQPINPLQAPGIAAIEQLSPVIQQAALNPQDAVALLTTAAAALTGNSAAPDDSKRVASSVTQFVSGPENPNGNQGSLIPSADIHLPGAVPGVPVPMPSGVSLPSDLNKLMPPGVTLPLPGPIAADPPSAHVPAAGAVPGGEAHLPAGIDPAHAVGPPPDAAPVAAPPAAVPAPDAVPAPAAPSTASAPPAAVPEAATVATPAPSGDTQPAPPAPAWGPDTPPTQEFMYPSIGNGCLSDGGNSLATAISVAGPASIPKPGPARGQTAYVFTAVGTPAPAPVQKLPLNVTWINITTGKSGSATLKPNPEINPDGPTTLVAIADTGSGSILSTIFGQVTTVDKQCGFMPTIGSTVVP
jgi:hypothetical protein